MMGAGDIDGRQLVVGIVGGMGSYATVDLFQRMVDAFPAERDWEKPRMIIDNYSTIPSRVKAILYGEKVEEVIDCMSASANNLIRSGATVLLFACHTSHAFLPKVMERIPRRRIDILNLLAMCRDECSRQGYSKVKLLASEGTVETDIYGKAFSGTDIEVMPPDGLELVQIRALIEDVKRNQISEKSLEEFRALVTQNEVPVILGCSELPVLWRKCMKSGASIETPVTDPLQNAIEYISEKYYRSNV